MTHVIALPPTYLSMQFIEHFVDLLAEFHLLTCVIVKFRVRVINATNGYEKNKARMRYKYKHADKFIKYLYLTPLFHNPLNKENVSKS